MQAARDPGTSQGLVLGVLLAQRHQAGHFMFSQTDLMAAGLVEGDIGNTVVEAHAGSSFTVVVLFVGMLMRDAQVTVP